MAVFCVRASYIDEFKGNGNVKKNVNNGKKIKSEVLD